jgi:glycosyltransferase involved in cell wall biosynthesis
MVDADLFVLPSYSENFGIAVAEAMAAGLPVVISDQVAIHREVSEAQAGVVVACETGELSQALLLMLSNPSLGTEMGRRGRQFTQTRYSVDNVARQLISAYNEALANSETHRRAAAPEYL